ATGRSNARSGPATLRRYAAKALASSRSAASPSGGGDSGAARKTISPSSNKDSRNSASIKPFYRVVKFSREGSFATRARLPQARSGRKAPLAAKRLCHSYNRFRTVLFTRTADGREDHAPRRRLFQMVLGHR